jgi:hypothetical protein
MAGVAQALEVSPITLQRFIAIGHNDMIDRCGQLDNAELTAMAAQWLIPELRRAQSIPPLTGLQKFLIWMIATPPLVLGTPIAWRVARLAECGDIAGHQRSPAQSRSPA